MKTCKIAFQALSGITFRLWLELISSSTIGTEPMLERGDRFLVLTTSLSELAAAQEAVLRSDLHPNRHLKRYGDFVVDLQAVPQPLERAMTLPEEIMKPEM